MPSSIIQHSAKAHLLQKLLKFEVKRHITKELPDATIKVIEPLFHGKEYKELASLVPVCSYEKAFHFAILLFLKFRPIYCSYKRENSFTKEWSTTYWKDSQVSTLNCLRYPKCLISIVNLFRMKAGFLIVLLLLILKNLVNCKTMQLCLYEKLRDFSKQRIHVLEPLASVLNPQYFHMELLQLYVRLAEMYAESADIMLEMREESHTSVDDCEVNDLYIFLST